MIDLDTACRATAALVAAVREAELNAPTPCDGFTVRALIEHIDQVARSADAPVPLADGWRDDVPDRVRGLATEWADTAAWEGTGPLDLPNATWGRIVLTELVVHGWDLARATGRTLELDDTTLKVCLVHVAEFVPNAPVPQLWSPPADVPDDAPLLDRIVAITGRKP